MGFISFASIPTVVVSGSSFEELYQVKQHVFLDIIIIILF